MSTIPTATGIGSKDGPYSSMIELLKIQIRFLEVAKEGKIDADTYAAYVGGLPLPALVGATAVDPHPDACRARQVDAECASSATAQSQPFDEWLKENNIAKRVVLALAKSGRYNKETKNIDSSWKQAFVEGSESITGRPHVTTSEEAHIVQKVRKKCTSKGWNFERVLRILVPVGGLDAFYGPQASKHSNPDNEPTERRHTQFPLSTKVRLVGKRKNISLEASHEGDDLYYIAIGSVLCDGSRGDCACEEGRMPVMVTEVFPHDGPLQRVGGEYQDELSAIIIEVNKPLRWHQSLIRVAPQEHVREKTKKKTGKSNKENAVRQSTRPRQMSGIFREILNSRGKGKHSTVTGKRGRKKNGGGKGPGIEASKPETEVVERPGKRRTTKITIGK